MIPSKVRLMFLAAVMTAAQASASVVYHSNISFYKEGRWPKKG